MLKTIQRETSRSSRDVHTQRSSGKRTLKKSVTIPASVANAVEAQVGPREFSSYVTEAVVRQLEHDRLSKLVDELTDIFGEVPENIAAEVDRQWRDALG
jgi:hypothetical protein